MEGDGGGKGGVRWRRKGRSEEGEGEVGEGEGGGVDKERRW